MRKGLLFLLVVFAGIAMAMNTAPYFPAAIGYAWLYQDSSDSGYDTLLTEITGTTTIDGYNTFLFVEAGVDTPDTQFFQVRADGVYNMFSMEIEMASVSFENYPVLVLKNPASIGEEWLSMDLDTNLTVMGFPASVQIEINSVFDGLEDVDTPLDNFRDCIKVTSTATWKVDAGVMFSDSGVDVYNVAYYADGIGLVRDTQYDIVGSIMGGGSGPVTSLLLDYDFTGISDDVLLPADVAIRAYPNPFNSAVDISVSGWDASRIEIFDVSGRLVESIDSKNIDSACRWSPKEGTESGVYLVRVITSQGILSTRAVYIK